MDSEVDTGSETEIECAGSCVLGEECPDVALINWDYDCPESGEYCCEDAR